MKVDRLQLQRFEMKYMVTESLAQAARDFVQSYLVLDENGVGKPDLSYPVHSIYLDAADLTLCYQTLKGEKNRFKMRMRYYDDLPGSPVFLEIKRRVNNAILKQRCAVTQEAVEVVLAGRMPDASQVLSTSPRHFQALEQFLVHVCQLRAVPIGQVAYRREAWVSAHDDSVRVTVDRLVRFDSSPYAGITTTLRNPVPVFGNKVILEMKFTGRFPQWFSEFVRIFGLVQQSAAKYVDGVVASGEARVKVSLQRQPIENFA